jgi:hypothetical protein
MLLLLTLISVAMIGKRRRKIVRQRSINAERSERMRVRMQDMWESSGMVEGIGFSASMTARIEEK